MQRMSGLFDSRGDLVARRRRRIAVVEGVVEFLGADARRIRRLAAGEVEFIFYALPMVPFMVLAAVYTLRDLSDKQTVKTVAGANGGTSREVTTYPYQSVAIAYVAAYVLMFLWFYPILTGWHLSYTLWRYHMWMRSWI